MDHSPGTPDPGLILLVSCAVFAASAARLPAWATVTILLAGAVFQVIGEMQHSAGSWHIGFDLAPPHRIGQYQGFFGTGVAVARTLGPTLVTVLVVAWGVSGWLLLGALFLGAGCATGPATRWAARTRPDAEPRAGLRGAGTGTAPVRGRQDTADGAGWQGHAHTR